MRLETDDVFDVTVVGGGLGGIAAAALLAQRGLRVVLLERAAALGGRGRTTEHQGFSFNQGAHALYAGGAAARVLRSLGVRPSARRPPGGGLAVRHGRIHVLPDSTKALLQTDIVPFRAKLLGAKFLLRLGSFDTKELAHLTWSEWLDGTLRDPAMRDVVSAFVRVTTYANRLDAISAGATIEQLRLAQTSGVLYVDGGWRSLVVALEAVARNAGVTIRTGVVAGGAAPRVEVGRTGWTLRFAGPAGDRAVRSAALVLATGPSAAHAVVPSADLRDRADRAVPARVACLDVALSRLPNPAATFALGIERPLYLSVHSRTARLGPPGGELVCTMKYLPDDGSPAGGDEAELEAWLERLQPGFRDVLVHRRFLPSMVATHGIPSAADGGGQGRPGPRVRDACGLFVVGDWVGREGMLLDAALASAEDAAAAIASDLCAKVA